MQQADSMGSELLHCCICPKQPNFSDSSHLLTHVSSKGHLSHLHKLQIRSQQETSARQKVARYNDWFTEHNVAQLLSERMQQKERKQARRKADNRRRCNTVKQQPLSNVDSALPDLPQPKVGRSESSFIDTSQSCTSASILNYRDMLDIAHIPARRSRSNSAQLPPSKSLWTPKRELNDDSMLPFTSSEHRDTPEAARLKGIIWPGMDIFDSADEVTQRKRNQKKDVSVLRKMQLMSQLVGPWETVCSPGGTIKKRRHMDELEDDSPVEGESPVAKTSCKRKRRAFTTLSSNMPLQRRRRGRAAPKSLHNESPLRNIGSNITTSSYYGHYHTRAARHDVAAPNMIASTPIGARKKPDFTVFKDEIPAFQHDMPYQPVLLPNPFIDEESLQERPLFPRPTSTEWLQPELRTSPYFDPFRYYRSQHTYADDSLSTVLGKENENPLKSYKDSKPMSSSPGHNMYGNFDDFDEALGPLAEVYAFIKNPLTSISPRRNDLPQTPQYSRGSKYQPSERTTHTFR